MNEFGILEMVTDDPLELPDVTGAAKENIAVPSSDGTEKNKQTQLAIIFRERHIQCPAMYYKIIQTC